MNLSKEVLERGLDENAFNRISFRLVWLQRAFLKRQEVLIAGNLASWEPEFAALNGNFADLAQTVLELVTLMNHKEQGPISPPNGEATPCDAPEGS